MSLAVTLFLCVLAVGSGLLVVAALGLMGWVAFNVIADGIAVRAKKAPQ